MCVCGRVCVGVGGRAAGDTHGKQTNTHTPTHPHTHDDDNHRELLRALLESTLVSDEAPMVRRGVALALPGIIKVRCVRGC